MKFHCIFRVEQHLESAKQKEFSIETFSRYNQYILSTLDTKTGLQNYALRVLNNTKEFL